MATVKDRSFESRCRTCLQDAALQMLDMFATAPGQDATPADMLHQCTLLKVAIEDALPKQLCASCYNCLASFYVFRKLAEKIDVQLRVQIEKRKDQDDTTAQKHLPVHIKLENEVTKQETDCDAEELKDGIIGLDIKQETSFIDESIEDNSLENYAFDDWNCNEVKGKAKCELCHRKFSSLVKLEQHRQRNSCHTTYTCNFCSKTFKRHHKYMKHMITHDQDILKSEINQNEPTSSLECTVCSVKYRSVNSLAAHMRKHTKKGRILACSICGKVFKKLSHVKRHELRHEVNRPFKCSQCPKRFNTESLLNEHVNKHNNIKPHACPMCNKSFALLATLSNHIKIHTREKPYLCPTCGKKFDSSTNLNQHMRRHAGLKAFSCTMCPKKFVSKGELNSHVTVHGSERSWRCSQCAAAFPHRRTLAQHLRRHAGHKPHQCDTCPMRFLTKDHLKRHYRIHTGEKPYKCSYCERAFTQSNDLVKHTRSHVGQNVYQCSSCPARFRLQTELRRHQSLHYLALTHAQPTHTHTPPDTHTHGAADTDSTTHTQPSLIKNDNDVQNDHEQ